MGCGYPTLLVAALLCFAATRAAAEDSAVHTDGIEAVIELDGADAGAPAEIEAKALERDCPNYGLVYMLGVWGGRCNDVDEGSPICMCRTVCPVCRPGSPSAIKCKESFLCSDWDITYWRNSSATI